MGYESVIFDNDGVLLTLTDMDAHYAGARRAFETVGVASPTTAHVEAMSIGVTVPELTAVCETYDIDPERFFRARDEAMAETQRSLILAGEKQPYGDIAALDRLDCPLGVVSSNQRETVAFAFEHFGLARHFDSVWAREPTVESLRRKKPRPYYLERAMDDLGVDNALFVGDNESDIEAAHRAGVDSAFIRRPHRVDAELGVDPDHDVRGLDDVVDLAG
ncbi:HAD family hydrolase [Haloarcula salina]|uniref:HAD family hydrolase n=1 Tax=Haloarcula salina TaxID=1429914 RepID=A0AA41KF10_9EURY|nr:HAD family hydrolase [Haloarcula salina]MBV0901572.1 HAD family hydrolase [Haloarcula salina]